MKKSLSIIALLVSTSFSYAQNNGIIWQEIVNSKVTNISALQPTTPPAELDKVKSMLSQSRQHQTCFVGDPANDFSAGVTCTQYFVFSIRNSGLITTILRQIPRISGKSGG